MFGSSPVTGPMAACCSGSIRLDPPLPTCNLPPLAVLAASPWPYIFLYSDTQLDTSRSAGDVYRSSRRLEAAKVHQLTGSPLAVVPGAVATAPI